MADAPSAGVLRFVAAGAARLLALGRALAAAHR